MAGNTKLRGFGYNGTVELQRWGSKVQVKLDVESIKALRAACYEQLPKKPPERMGELNPIEAAVDYEESTGRVLMNLIPFRAKQLAELLRAGAVGVKKENADLAESCAANLESAYQEHLDYIDTDEPGIEKK